MARRGALAIYVAGTAMPDTLHHAPIAIVDEDGSALSQRIAAAFYPPEFGRPTPISLAEVDPGMDSGRYTFVLDIPPNFQRDMLAGRAPQLQLNVDATRMGQAFTGNGAIVQFQANGKVVGLPNADQYSLCLAGDCASMSGGYDSIWLQLNGQGNPWIFMRKGKQLEIFQAVNTAQADEVPSFTPGPRQWLLEKQ